MSTDPIWPASLPLEPEMSGYQETLGHSAAVYSPDVGTPSMWLRSTLPGDKVAGHFLMDDSQKDAFSAFYFATLSGGTQPFAWSNPAYSVEGRYLFDPATPPQITASGYLLWDVTITLLRLS